MVDFTFPWCFLALVVVVVVLLDALPLESAEEFVVVVSVLTFLPLSLVSVLVVVLESVVDSSAFWANMAVAVKSATKMNFFIRSLAGSRRSAGPGSTTWRDRPGNFVTSLSPAVAFGGFGASAKLRAGLPCVFNPD